MSIRNEKPEDYRTVEELIKKTFWNLSVPGCNEHYLAHQIRKSEEYIPELDFVLEEDGKIIESPAHQMDESGFEEFDSTFEQMEKWYSYTQELFYIYSRSNVLR